MDPHSWFSPPGFWYASNMRIWIQMGKFKNNNKNRSKLVIAILLKSKIKVNLDQLHNFLHLSFFNYKQLDPDPHWEKQLDPDSQKMNSEQQPWFFEIGIVDEPNGLLGRAISCGSTNVRLGDDPPICRRCWPEGAWGGERVGVIGWVSGQSGSGFFFI